MTRAVGVHGQRAVRGRAAADRERRGARLGRDEAADDDAGHELDAAQVVAARGRGRVAGAQAPRPWRRRAWPARRRSRRPGTAGVTSRTVAVTAAIVLSAVVRPRSAAEPRRRDRRRRDDLLGVRALRRGLAREEGGDRVLRAVAEVAGDDRVAGEGHRDELRAGDPRGDARRRPRAACAGRSRRRGSAWAPAAAARAAPAAGSRWASATQTGTDSLRSATW